MARVRFAILYVLAWTPLAVLYGLVLGSQRDMDVASTIAGTVWTIGSAALLGAIVWWLSTRIHYRRTHLARFLALRHCLRAALRVDDAHDTGGHDPLALCLGHFDETVEDRGGLRDAGRLQHDVIGRRALHDVRDAVP